MDSVKFTGTAPKKAVLEGNVVGAVSHSTEWKPAIFENATISPTFIVLHLVKKMYCLIVH